MVGPRQVLAFRTGHDERGRALEASDRERLLQPYLPASPPEKKYTTTSSLSPSRFHHSQRVRPVIRHLLHSLIFAIVHTLFSAYIRVRATYNAVGDRMLAVMYYHHRTPEIISRDVKRLSKVPQHLSVILQLPPEGGKNDRVETLFNDASELAAWTASAGIPMLSIYERTGALKQSLPQLHRHISRNLTSYFGAKSPNKPTVSLRAPHMLSFSPPDSPKVSAYGESDSSAALQHLVILLIDESDGRQTIVDLTKTLAEMSQTGKLAPSDISSELVDAEITESVMVEPDLLVTFGDRVVLEGYPPWQARITEMFCMQDNHAGVGYHLFLRALYKYAKAEFRVGR